MGDIDVDSLLDLPGGSKSAKSMCYKTVDTFAGIVQRKLWLKDAQDGQPKTNGFLIEVPFRHARAYQYCEHEISHILFETDPLAKAKFVAEYAAKIAQVAQQGGAPINERMLRGGLDGIVNVLDDERVISLWGLLYKGSERIMRRMKLEEAQPFLSETHSNFLSLLMMVASDNPIQPGKLDRFVPYMVEALRKVHLRDYYGCMVTAKWLVVQLVSEIIRESRGEDPPPMPGMSLGTAPSGQSGSQDDTGGLPDDDQDAAPPSMPWEDDGAQDGAESPGGGHGQDAWEPPEVDASLAERSKALQDAIDGLGQVPSQVKNTIGEVTESKFKRRGEEAAANRRSRMAINADVKDSGKLEDALAMSADQMLRIVDKARHSTRNTPKHDDSIRRDAFAKVVFTDVKPSIHADPHQRLSDGDEEIVRRLRATFHKVMGRRINTLEDAGSEVDIPALIARRMTGEPLAVFRVDRHGRGFKTLVLVDRSSSMSGTRTMQAERSCRIITRALKFPFVDTKVWGFQSWKDGEVDITRFQAGREVFESDSAKVGGVTPLHTAIRVALRELEDGTDRKHLFVISDGFPIFSRRDGAQFGTKTLMNFVRGNVMTARTKGIGVTGVLIGRDMQAKAMAHMFGPSKYWRIMKDNSFGNDLIGLVTGAFMEYLRAA
jgi:hypothetical protein